LKTNKDNLGSKGKLKVLNINHLTLMNTWTPIPAKRDIKKLEIIGRTGRKVTGVI
jgi:hypothetical protein